MLQKLLAAILSLPLGASLHAGQIQGQITDEQGDGLKGVLVCLSAPDAAEGECLRTGLTNRSGTYTFSSVGETRTYIVKVLTGTALRTRKADPYPNYTWEPVTHKVKLARTGDEITGIDFTGTFNFSNFQAEFELRGDDFPELYNYDLANDYVFLKVYTADPVNSEQNLIFLGQVADISKLFIEASLPLSATELIYEVYSAAAPDPVIVSISASSISPDTGTGGIYVSAPNTSTGTIDLSGTIETSDGNDVCAMVLASGKHTFSCFPNGYLSLIDLSRERNGAVKLQIYAEGFKPFIVNLTEPGQQQVAITSSGSCLDYNQMAPPGKHPESAGQWIHVTGKTLVGEDQFTPICAMVLANGQYMFSCGGSGDYALNVPLDSNGQVKLQVYADGFAPTILYLDEFNANNTLYMARASECR